MRAMRGAKRGWIFGATFVGACFFAAPVFAAEGAPAFPWNYWIVGMINLAIFLAIIIKFGGASIQGFFAGRRAAFLADMNAAKRAREEAQARLEELNERLEALEKERQALLDEYHAQGEREKQRLVETAKKQVEKMRVDAEAAINQEVKKAVAMLREQAVDRAVESARAKAVERLDAGAQDELFDDILGQIKEAGSPIN